MDYAPYKISLKFTQEPVKVELITGAYNVYLLGGFSISRDESFSIDIVSEKTGMAVNVHEPFLKPRDYTNGRSIKYFDFVIDANGVYIVTLHHFENIRVKRSMHPLIKLLQEPVPLNKLKLLITRD
jgi:hypothetical protein